jgi:hypothetical protein
MGMPGAQEVGGGPSGDPLSLIATALEALERAGTARVAFGLDLRVRLPQSLTQPAWRLLPGPLAPLARRAGRRLRRSFRIPVAEGVIDLTRGVAALDYGRHAILIEAGWERGGRSGAAPVGPATPAGPSHPIWLLDLLRGAVEAESMGTDRVRGATLDRLAARCDLRRASLAARHPMPAPEVARVEDLERLPVDVWLDGAGLVRRVRHERVEGGLATLTFTLDLLDFGVPVAREWPTLPRFKARRAESSPHRRPGGRRWAKRSG